jgi:DNA processing protein
MDQRGPIISWFPIRTFPEPQNFPIRNRIIAGITLGTAALGGAQSRGSFVAARLAMEFGREVFSVPGNATEPSQFGPNQLTKQGAQLVTGWEDVWRSCRPQDVPSCCLSRHLPSAERATLGSRIGHRQSVRCVSC